MPLSAKQARSIAALLDPACHTNAQAADTAGVPLRTLARWLAEDSEFREALAQAQTDMIARASMRLAALTDAALVSLADNLSFDAQPQHALRAAKIVLDAVVKFNDHVDLAARITALEAARDNEN